MSSVLALLAESRRPHYHCDDSWYCCGKCTHEDHGPFHSGEGPPDRSAERCNCGADAWNAKVDAVLTGHLAVSDRPEDYTELRESLRAQAAKDRDAAALLWHTLDPREQWAVFFSALEEIQRLRDVVWRR